MAATFWGKFDEAAEAAAASSATVKMPVVELKMVEASEPPVTESGSAVLARGIRSLYERRQFCDVFLVVAGERMSAHKSMLAALSTEFRQFLYQEPGAADPMKGMLSRIEAPSPAVEDATTTPAVDSASPAEGTAAAAPVTDSASSTTTTTTSDAASESAVPSATVPEPAQSEKPIGQLELQVGGITTPESLKIMLSYVYDVGTGADWVYDPLDADVNKDILRLARSFGMPHLHEHAARWLTKGLTTQNVVERLVTCEEFGLMALREKIIEQLTANPAELTAVTSSPDIIKHPRILQDLLMQVACLCGVNQKKTVAKTEKAEKIEKHEKAPEKVEKQQEDEEEAEEEEPEPVKKKKIETKSIKVPAEPEKPAAKRQKRSAAGA